MWPECAARSRARRACPPSRAGRTAGIREIVADSWLPSVAAGIVEKTIPFYMSVSQYEYWKHTHLTVDVVKGRGSGFSVEAPEGVRFMIRSRLLTDGELAQFFPGEYADATPVPAEAAP
jgi:hypothetical protein